MAKNLNEGRRIALVEVDKLTPHKLQKDVFRDTTGDAFEQLKQAVKSGEIDPIEITVDNVIIDGHQRVRAAKAAGVKKIQAWVRDDLKDQKSIDERFIMANLNRRQMSKLDQARAYRQLKRTQGRPWRAEGDTRDFIARQFGNSGRTLDRYLRVLDTPKVVQEAVDDGKLSMQDGIAVSFLERGIQKEIAGLIRKGKDPKDVVKRYAKRSRNRRRKRVCNPYGKRCRKLLDEVQQFLAETAKHRTAVHKALYTDDEDLLKQLRTFCRKALKYLERNPKQRVSLKETIAEFVGCSGSRGQSASDVRSPPA